MAAKTGLGAALLVSSTGCQKVEPKSGPKAALVPTGETYTLAKDQKIFGNWEMSDDYNDFKKLEKKLVFKNDRTLRPDLYMSDSNQLYFATSQAELKPFSDNFIELCVLVRIVWAPITDAKFRDFYVECQEAGDTTNTKVDVFGEFKLAYGPRPYKYNFRLFGPNMSRLRFRDREGLDYFFKRTSRTLDPYWVQQ